MLDKFIIFYDNGSTVEGSTIQEWEIAPVEGIMGVILLLSDGCSRVCSGNDFYFMHDFGQGIVSGNSDDTATFLRRFPWVKFGRFGTEKLDKDIASAMGKIGEKWYKEHNPELSTKGCCGD